VTLIERLQTDMRAAMRARDELARDTLRMVLADVKNRRIELGRELEDADVEGVLQRCVKTRTDSVEQYSRAGREELAARERGELDVIARYLPEQMSPQDVRAAVARAIAEVGATAPRDTGAVMKALMSQHKGRIDGKAAQQAVAELLRG